MSDPASIRPTRGEWTDDGFAVIIPAMKAACGNVVTFDRAFLNNSLRSINATITQPGRVGSCSFLRVAVEVKDRYHGNDEVWAWASRGRSGLGFNESFTDKSRPLLIGPIQAAVAMEGFGKIWAKLFCGSKNGERIQEADTAAARARWAADWWTEAGQISRMFNNGVLELVQAPHDASGRLPWVDVPEIRNGWYGTTHKAAAALFLLDEEQVGWLLEDGSCAPYRFRAQQR